MGKIILNGVDYTSEVVSVTLQPVIYSTEEREIGCWTDAKPLYQKTFYFESPLNVSYNSWTSMGVSVENGENIISCISISTDGTNTPLMGYFDSDVVKCQTPRNASVSWNVKYLTIQYTKTSDTAGSGTWNTSGIPNVHYSSAEHVVGTWIDGKPIYEITVNTGTLPNNTTKTTAHGISDLKAVIDLRGYARNPNNGINIPIPYVYKSGSYSKSLQAYSDATNITFISGENMSGYTESYVTLQYTKTTD